MDKEMYPELEKLRGVSERSQAIGEFLEWLFGSKNYHIAKYLGEEEYEDDEDELVPVHIDIEKLLAEFFGIDLAKAEEERREILEQIREKQ